jgi:hypothetical protein
MSRARGSFERMEIDLVAARVAACTDAELVASRLGCLAPGYRAL